jgi:hypothetical protein
MWVDKLLISMTGVYGESFRREEWGGDRGLIILSYLGSSKGRRRETDEAWGKFFKEKLLIFLTVLG